MMPENIPTPPDILERLCTPPAYPMTAQQAAAQRISFVYGNLPQSSTMTRQEVEARLSGTESGTV